LESITSSNSWKDFEKYLEPLGNVPVKSSNGAQFSNTPIIYREVDSVLCRLILERLSNERFDTTYPSELSNPSLEIYDKTLLNEN
jgi:hypothetical protein